MMLMDAKTTCEKIKILEINLEMAMMKIYELEGKLKVHMKTVGLHSKEI